MRKPLIMVVDDEGDSRVHDVKMALAKEHHERSTAIHVLIQQGHVSVVEDMDPANIQVQIEDELFTDKRDEFPSTQLIARVQLALAAGRSERNRAGDEATDHALDAMRYAYRRAGKSDLMSYAYGARAGGGMQIQGDIYDQLLPPAVPWSDAMEIAHHNTARITATVKPQKYRKGLRP